MKINIDCTLILLLLSGMLALLKIGGQFPGKLKELRATQYSMPVYSNDIEAVPNGYGSISVVPKLNYETVTDIIMHLSNQLNDDIKATVRGDTELVIEVNEK